MAADYAGQKLVVLGLNYQESLQIVQTYQDMYPNIIMLRDAAGTIYQRYRQNGYIPLNYVVTQEQTVDWWMEGFNESIMRNHIEALLPAVTVVLENDGVPVPQGGELSFDVTVHNWENTAQTFYALTQVTLPGGATVTLMGPLQLTLDAGQELSVTLTEDIPGMAPLGIYTFEAKLGTYPPVELMDSSSFEFEVTAP